MKYLATLLCALAMLAAIVAQAAESKDTSAITAKPMTIKGGKSARMSVVFNHTSHFNQGLKDCESCHHASPSDDPTVSCTVEGCHEAPGARERDPAGMFMAFHSKDERSCYGCHSALAAKDPKAHPEFKGCRPCHMSPGARKAMEARLQKK